MTRITYDIIGVTIRIHRRLGSRLLEWAYHDLMLRDLVRMGYFVESRKRVGFEFEGSWIENGLTSDLIVERKVIVEIKVAVAVAPVHQRQLLTYLRLTELPVGLLINFGGEVLHKNIRRFVNNLKEQPHPSASSAPSACLCARWKSTKPVRERPERPVRERPKAPILPTL